MTDIPKRQSDPLLRELYISPSLYYIALFWHWITGHWIDGDDLHELKKHNQIHWM